MSITETIWLVIGFGGQGLFFARWIVQWFRSERERESTIPLSFWYLSLIGGLITLTYAIYRRDPVFITGQAVGSLVYLRNLMLIYRKRAPIPRLRRERIHGPAPVRPLWDPACPDAIRVRHAPARSDGRLSGRPHAPAELRGTGDRPDGAD